MAWNLDADRPVYTQLVEKIQMQIVSGQYLPGGRLPSVRELAMIAAVNPNTMQKALSELERTGLIITQRTNGRTVTEDVELISGIREQLARDNASELFTKMNALGYTDQETVALIQSIYQGKE